MRRGFFEVGILNGRTPANLGTLWRSAWQLGAAGIFTIGEPYKHQPSNTVQAQRHIPLRHYADFHQFLQLRPHDCQIIAVETCGMALREFQHPERAIYLLGAEDTGLPPDVLNQCNSIVSLESVRRDSYNVAVAGSIVLYHRQFMGNVNG